VVDDVTARRRAEIAGIVARMPAGRRAGLVAALRAFAAASGEPDAPAADFARLGWA
jgi:hypothetical protein